MKNSSEKRRFGDLAVPGKWSSTSFAQVLMLLAVMVSLSLAVGAQAPIRIACVGDSITEGTANADYRLNSWPAVLGRLLESRFPGRYVTANFGRSGATLLRKGAKPYRGQDVFAASHRYDPQIVIINLGTNDANPARWAAQGAEFEGDLTDLVRSYAALPSKPKIWLSNLTSIYERYSRFSSVHDVRARIEACIEAVARKHGLNVIDLKSPTSGKAALFPDGLHPNTAGNELIAQAVFKALTSDEPPSDPSLHPTAIGGAEVHFVKDGKNIGMHLAAWNQKSDRVEGTGARNLLTSLFGIRDGAFHLKARLRMLNQKNSAAGFMLNENFFGFEGAAGTVFRNGPQMGGLRLLHHSAKLWERDSWVEFEVIREHGIVWFLVNGTVLDMAPIPGVIDHLAFDPTRSSMQISSLSVVGDTFRMNKKIMPRGFTIPIIDLDADEGRHVVVDREKGQYLGHVSTVLLEDGKTILAVYPKGHGRGPIVYKRSSDGGLTWSERLPTPKNWATSKEVPTIHRVIDPKSGKKRLIMWSGLHPARLAVSEDDGENWSDLKPVGNWGGIVVMGFVERLKNGSYLAMFHDDGRFYGSKSAAKRPRVFTLYQTLSHDGGLTWQAPTIVWSGSKLHLCEPGCVRSPDGKALAVLLRENSRRRNSHIIFSTDEGQSWSRPRELPASLTGDRHTTAYAPDGRLFICFRDTALESKTQGDWVGWVGRWEDLVKGGEGQYRIRFKDNKHKWDTTYPGVAVLPDGTFVVTTYGHWKEGKPPYILSARFTLDELDQRVPKGKDK